MKNKNFLASVLFTFLSQTPFTFRYSMAGGCSSISLKSGINEVIIEISEKRLGVTAVTENSRIVGIITDGDIRRMLEQHTSIQDLKALDIYHKAPITIDPNELAVNALALMEQKDISQIIVAEESNYVGMIHMHDLMREGIL